MALEAAAAIDGLLSCANLCNAPIPAFPSVQMDGAVANALARARLDHQRGGKLSILADSSIRFLMSI